MEHVTGKDKFHLERPSQNITEIEMSHLIHISIYYDQPSKLERV